MARFDAVGLFWEDRAPEKPPKKEKPKAIPPEPVWLLATYLPGLHEARNMQMNLLSDQELIEAWRAGERLNYDIECYPNYFLLTARSITSGKCLCFEAHDGGGLTEQDQAMLGWVLNNFTMVGFNIKHYDNVMATIAAAGYNTDDLWRGSCMIFEKSEKDKRKPKYQGWQVLKKFGLKTINIDSIDLIEYTALRPSLKKLAGRTHAPRMQDLPFVPGTMLTPDQKTITKWYNVNDLDVTELVYHRYIERIALREKMSAKYGIDLRSRSDAQMAEAIVEAEIKKLTGQQYLTRGKIEPGKTYKYKKPAFIQFFTPILQQALQIVLDSGLYVSENGKVKMPQALADLVIPIGKSTYQMGIGGLHSQEKSVGHVADEEYMIVDTDATSFYPFLILNSGLAPENLGRSFLIVYNGIVVDRVNAKKAGDVIAAEGLKITANGTYGKLGSPWSIMYAPELLTQVTLNGQLSLLMFIEMMEYQGFEVISANTDGVVCKVHRSRKEEFDGLVKYWEKQTGMSTEETRYSAVYSRDVNTYVAIYETPQKGKLFKSKGSLFNCPHPDKSADASTVDLKKNPVTEICTHAVIELLLRGTPIRQTIRECKIPAMFVEVRDVKGGGVYITPNTQPEYLGKTVRWYHAVGVSEESRVVYAKSGNKVANSEGSKPMMTLPAEIPSDIDYDWYEQRTIKNMVNMGYLTGRGIEADTEFDDEENDELAYED